MSRNYLSRNEGKPLTKGIAEQWVPHDHGMQRLESSADVQNFADRKGKRWPSCVGSVVAGPCRQTSFRVRPTLLLAKQSHHCSICSRSEGNALLFLAGPRTVRNAKNDNGKNKFASRAAFKSHRANELVVPTGTATPAAEEQATHETLRWCRGYSRKRAHSPNSCGVPDRSVWAAEVKRLGDNYSGLRQCSQEEDKSENLCHETTSQEMKGNR